MRVYTYVVRIDSGFAPNPFHGWCTLACCKPRIRRTAKPGDWIVGMTPRAQGNRVVYAAQVEEVLPFASYWSDARFAAKRPEWVRGAPTVRRRGDNCYEPAGDGQFRQLPSCHWDSRRGRENASTKAVDLGGEHVLVAGRFCYFGADAAPLPPKLGFAIPGRGHRVRFTDSEREQLTAYVEALPPGLHGQPTVWPKGDTSWEHQEARCG